MTNETRNEAANTLRNMFVADGRMAVLDKLNEALAAERRATVERLRSRIRGRDITYATRRFLENILDEEAR